jgi:hypothetical protein
VSNQDLDSLFSDSKSRFCAAIGLLQTELLRDVGFITVKSIRMQLLDEVKIDKAPRASISAQPRAVHAPHLVNRGSMTPVSGFAADPVVPVTFSLQPQHEILEATAAAPSIMSINHNLGEHPVQLGRV